MLDRNKIYAVKLPEDIEEHSIAMYVRELHLGDRKGIEFIHPGNRGHFFEGRIENETQDGFTFFSTSKGMSGLWIFTEVTHMKISRRK